MLRGCMFCLATRVAELVAARNSLRRYGSEVERASVTYRDREAGASPVERSVQDAVSAFLAFHRKNPLSPTTILSPDSHAIKLVFVPFWAFKVSASATYSADVGHGRHPSSEAIVWAHSSTFDIQEINKDFTDACVQVAASYSIRRDFCEGLKASLSNEAVSKLVPHTLPISKEQVAELSRASRLPRQDVQMDGVEMRQAIAWQLALRSLRHEQERSAVQTLQSTYKTEHVKGVQLRLFVHSRAARLFYVPAYIISYAYGKHQLGSIEIVGQTHEALVSAAAPAPVIVADRHFSPLKAQAVAAGSVAAATAAAAGVAGVAGASVDAAFAAFVAASAAGVLARGYTGYMRGQHAEAVEAQVGARSEDYMKDGMSGMHVEDAHDGWRRVDVEWLRWQEADKWDWDGGKRRAWAERLFKEQLLRRKRNEEEAARWQEEEAKRQRQAAREAIRAARFGSSRRRPDAFFSGGARAVGILDFKGYYKILGFTDEQCKAVSSADIKEAYREAAKREHPDLLVGGDASSQRQAAQRFQELTAAYNVLRDPEKRKRYDAGSAVD